MSTIQSFFTLRPAFPEIHASVDFRNQRDLLIRIDAILTGSTMEHELIYDLMRRRGDRDYPKVFNRHLQGLRCCILRHLMGLDFREFAFRLADSVLLQWFTFSAPYGIVNPPAKSTLERYNKNFSKELIESLIYELTLKAANPDSEGHPGEPDPPLDLDAVFADCTCVQANIHHPVDWVLLRDGVRTLMGAIKLIRREGLCHRMEKPETFLCRINELCMEMSAVRRKSDSKSRRKKVLRKMKKLSKQVESHGWRYWKMLSAEWENTAWSRAQTDQVLERMETVLLQMPMARRQAHERIIGERKVPNDEKILSLYEPDIHVVVRGKAGAEVEFGNKLYLAEQENGVIVDWKLYKERVPSDCKLVKDSIERIRENLGGVDEYVTDRGFDSEANRKYLKKEKINNGMCPKDPKELTRRKEEAWFGKRQKRRAGTEARVGI
ncbi:MAG: hypothetical protein WD425_03970, partial [Nitrospirales bacterium]